MTENTFIGYVSSSTGLHKHESSGFLEKMATTLLEKHKKQNLSEMIQDVEDFLSVSL
jgi:hypothetical protein